MKRVALILSLAVVALVLAGCGSLRTPTSGPRSKNVYYNTFFGLTIEGGVYGDGFIISPAGK